MSFPRLPGIALWGVCLAAVTLLEGPFSSASAEEAAQTARQLLDQAGLRGGFVVHLGCGTGELTAALRQRPALLVHGLDRDPANVAAARQTLVSAGVYGPVAVDRLTGPTLPYVDNLVNLLVVEDLGEVSHDELLRVLVPHGVALVQGADGAWTKTVKPRPAEMDDWTHYLHDPSGNAVAHDALVGPPRHLQWVGTPRWSRHHDRMASMSALVSEGGKLFYIMDEGSRVSIQLPAKWKLIARDAFNGTILWKRDIPQWQTHLFPLKSGPTQLARRLAAVDGVVYVTLGYEAPLTALDAETGETIREFEGSANCEEVIVSDGLVFVLANREGLELREYAPLNPVVGDQADVRERWHWNEKPRVVMGYDAATGKQLWAKEGLVSPLTLCCDSTRVYFHDGERITALDRRTGDHRWTSEPASRRSVVTFNFGPRLVVYDDVVLYAGGDGKMSAYDAASGRQLWSAQHPPSGYQSPQDLIVMQGLVWCAPTTSTRDSGIYTGRDLRTGQVRKEFPPNVETYWFHHRCYIAKATDKFLIPSRTGIEFVDPEREHWDIHHWVRGGCLYGVLPCNGLLYAPPHNCACYPEAKLYGFNALAPRAPTRPVPRDVPEEGRLEPGPAYADPLVNSVAEGDWPTYRGDNERSGFSPRPVGADLQTAWNRDVGGRLTPPVIAGGLVVLSRIDAHTVLALDAASGAPRWSFTAGGSVDSPPTIAGGRVVFGCADGWVYALRAADGALCWRYRAAPEDRRLFAFESLESVWPVSGSVLVRDNAVYAVAGRSVFLDGGLRMVKLDLATGRKLAEELMDDRNPATGNNLQEVTKILQGPVGLPDILSATGENIFMRSQKFDWDCRRLEIGPHSGEFVVQGSVQRGPGVHLFAPMGFLDDTWFHRSYWVFGRSFAGGHAGYYQAGKFAPAGQILVTGGGYVYGYGRKPEHYRWTTVLEHHLFAASTDPKGIASPEEAPATPAAPAGRRRNRTPTGVSTVQFGAAPSLNPARKPLTVEAWVRADKPNGTILAHGGPTNGYALVMDKGRPVFCLRTQNELSTITGPDRIAGQWHHVAAVLTADKELRLYVDGRRVATGAAKSLLPSEPKQNLQLGADEGGAVGEYQSPFAFTGLLDEVRVYLAALSDEEIERRHRDPAAVVSAEPVLSLSLETDAAEDASPARLTPDVEAVARVEGKVGGALQFGGAPSPAARGAPAAAGSQIEPKWAQDVPIYVRGMVLADRDLVLIGPPDLIDEHETFARLSGRDSSVEQLLAEQDAALEGGQGSRLLVVDSDSGEVRQELALAALPVWDGLAAARGRLFLTTLDGQVLCFTGE